MRPQNLSGTGMNIKAFSRTLGSKEAMHAIKICIFKVLKVMQKPRVCLDSGICLASTNVNSMVCNIPAETYEKLKFSNLYII